MINLPHDHGIKSEKVLESIPNSQDFQLVSDLFKLLADANRVKIFLLLCHCEECVINISAAMEMSSPAVSHHLKLLKSAGLLVTRREGKEVYYKAADNPQSAALHNMIESLLAIACPDK